MNQPDIATQRAILENSIKQLEAECYNHQVAGEAYQTIGLADEAKKRGDSLATSMKLHAFYTAKLNELA